MEALILKLESATEGSDVLDREIANECGIAWSPDEDGNYGGYNILPRRCWFSRSLDAALTLTSEDWDFVDVFRDAGQWFAWVQNINDDGSHFDIKESAPTGPLALCLAALRARMKQP